MTPDLEATQSQQMSTLDPVAVPEPSVVSQILSLDDITAPQNHGGGWMVLLLACDGCTMSYLSFSSVRHLVTRRSESLFFA
jgi:hypothetical protein